VTRVLVADDVAVEAPSGTITLLFSDIEASTRLLERLGSARYAEVLEQHRRLLRGVFAEHHGYEVDIEGDAFFVVFARASDAVAAAGEGQQALAAAVWPVEGVEVRVRMGLHTGEPVLVDGNYVGMDVHTAARIMAAACGRQVVLSESTRALLGDSFRLSDLGEHRLKDLSDAHRLYQLGVSSFPPLKTLNNTNLPVPASSFVGRERELADVASLLRTGPRLVTLTGPGGSGKTRLAIEAAAEVVGDYRDGVYWVGLAGLGEAALVVDAIAQTLGANDGLAEQIGDRALLLVLDNFEHVITAGPELSTLLAVCRNLRILVTSRELLRLQGEAGYPVPPLAQGEAEQLFSARSRLPRDDEIADLCRRLDNMPLAVELAAARTSILSPAQILERLAERLDLLRGGRDAAARQQTLRATIGWSFDLLTPAEQQLFGRLSIFPGGCTVDAVEAVCDGNLDDLQSLVEKSLVQRNGERFTMLETVMDFARERLAESGELALLTRRLGERLFDVAESFHTERDLGRVGSIRSLELELDNIRATLTTALEWPEDPLALRLVRALSWFWSATGRRSEAFDWVTQALERGPRSPTHERARALESATAFAALKGDAELTLGFGHEALALFRAAGDEDGEAGILRWLGEAHALAGDLAEARRCLAESISLWHKLGDRVSLARTLGTRSEIERHAGDLSAARKDLQESLHIAEAVGAEGLASEMLESLGELALRRGDVSEAARFYLEALERGSDIDAFHTLYCVAGLAATAAVEGIASAPDACGVPSNRTNSSSASAFSRARAHCSYTR